MALTAEELRVLMQALAEFRTILKMNANDEDDDVRAEAEADLSTMESLQEKLFN